MPPETHFNFWSSQRSTTPRSVVLSIVVGKELHWVELRVDDDTYQDATSVRERVTLLMDIIAGGNVTLEAPRLKFERGQDLSDMAADLRDTLEPSEIDQS